MQDYREQEACRCNQCGKTIKVHNDILQEDILHVEKVWGYFSECDGKKQVWNLCENCYNKMIEGFALPPEETQATELL